MGKANPWEPLDSLREAIQNVLAPLHVELNQWVVMPGMDGEERRYIQVIVKARKSAFQSDEQRATIDEFEAILEADRIASAAERAQQKKGELREKLSNADGFLDDLDTPEE